MQPILQHLFQVSSLDEVSRQRLESFVEEYPSFGMGHYLLSRKLKAEGSDRFAAETQKTSLYFTNPFWLQWQLDHAAAARESFVAAPPVEEDHVAPPPEGLVIPAAGVVTVAEESYGVPEGDDLAEALSAPPPEEHSAADELLRRIEEAKGLRDTLQKINTDFEAETGLAGENLAVEEPIHDDEAPFVLDEAARVTPEVASEPIHDEEPPFVLDEPDAVVEAVVAAEPEPVATIPEPAAPAPGSEPVAPPPGQQPVDSGLVFEPYHTIDYFASQGIKLTLDENPKDKLGKQLKSFTEWLKGMRRLPQKDREVIPDRVAEEAVQNIAAHSIQSKDVVTETMAEVLAMQGMRERARVVYEKLSLLNPGKRAYFAAKIEQLNIP
ncbi:MAG TPA: hypothetical protein VHE34_14110 [Puia sp.]|uniref:hypothetical protein n=1 Tax=Puia sp. TaxID=2045100 RepID=UPI002BEF91A4|nr:hypothetical protein [Puia sp.]HVU96358.1 hypothetical protein [Puia sp.]